MQLQFTEIPRTFGSNNNKKYHTSIKIHIYKWFRIISKWWYFSTFVPKCSTSAPEFRKSFRGCGYGMQLTAVDKGSVNGSTESL